MEKITGGDLEGGWQPPAPDQGLRPQGLRAFCFFMRASPFKLSLLTFPCCVLSVVYFTKTDLQSCFSR